MVKIGTELEKIGTELEKIGTEMVKLGTELVLLSRGSDYRNNSERFFRKFRIRNEVPIIGTSGNPGLNGNFHFFNFLALKLFFLKKKLSSAYFKYNLLNFFVG